MNLLQCVLEEQDLIDQVATDLIATGFTGHGFPATDRHPGWDKTARLKHSVSRIVSLRLAENRSQERNLHAPSP